MKILEINIFDDSDNLIRQIKLNENHLFLVYGNIKKPQDTTKTINSIGKTLFLKMIKYILGYKCDNEIIESKISNYYITSTISYNYQLHQVKRFLNQNSIILDKLEMSLDDYINAYSINRKLLSRQVRLYPKGCLLGFNKNEKQEDYVEFLSLIGLTNLSKKINSFYDLKKKSESLEKTKSELFKLLNISEKKISQEIFINSIKLKEKETLINENSLTIKNLKLSENTIELQRNFEDINSKLKDIEFNLQKSNHERDNLFKFINDCKDKNPSVSSIIKIYEQSKYEVPGIVKRKLEEAYSFYNSVILDRIENINTKINLLNKNIEEMLIIKEKLKQNLDEIGLKLSNNNLYKTAIDIIEKLNKEYADLKYKEGQMAQVKQIILEIESLENQKISLFSNINDEIRKVENKIKEYREFIYKIVKDIYDKDITAYFDICTESYRVNCIPIHINLNVLGETGEGILEVKKNIMDILMFSFNDDSDILILDSSCFNGIDPRQVSGLLDIINNICIIKNKQAIVSINKYQVINNYKNKFDNLLELSEDDKLLKLNY